MWGSLIAPVLEEVQRELVLGVDDPDEQEAVALELRHRERHNVCVRQLTVAK